MAQDERYNPADLLTRRGENVDGILANQPSDLRLEKT